MPIENKNLTEAVIFFGKQAFFPAAYVSNYNHQLLMAVASLDAGELHTEISNRLRKDFPDTDIEQAIFEFNGEQLKRAFTIVDQKLFKDRFNDYAWVNSYHPGLSQRTFTMNARREISGMEKQLDGEEGKMVYLIVGMQNDVDKVNAAVKLEEDCYAAFRLLAFKAIESLCFEDTSVPYYEYRLPLLFYTHATESMNVKIRQINDIVCRVDPDAHKLTYDLVYDEVGAPNGGPGWPLVRIRCAAATDSGRTQHGL